MDANEKQVKKGLLFLMWNNNCIHKNNSAI